MKITYNTIPPMEITYTTIHPAERKTKTEKELFEHLRKITKAIDELYDQINWTLEELESRLPIDTMPFGKHEGKPLKEVPKDYVIWLLTNGRLDIKENLPLKKSFERIYDLSEEQENKND